VSRNPSEQLKHLLNGNSATVAGSGFAEWRVDHYFSEGDPVEQSTGPLDKPAILTRRQFTAEAVLALLMGCVITVTEGCGNDDSPTNPASPGDINGVISANHGHTATILSAQIVAATAIVGMDIRGTATHSHTISISQAQLQTLSNRQPVTVTSTTDSAHDHTVTFTPV
jgi:hypothetical protein